MAASEPQSERTFDLASISVPQLLFELLSQRFTGVVRVEPSEGGFAKLGFAGGLPRWCDAEVPGSRIGELLVEAGAVDQDTLDQAAGDGEGTRLGEYLVEKRLVEETQVRDCLREQTEKRLIELCGTDRGRVIVKANNPSKNADFPDAAILPVILEGVRRHFTASQLNDGLRDVIRRPFVATAALAKYAPHFRFTDQQQTGIVALPGEGGIAFEDWVTDSGLELDEAKRLLFALTVCRMVAAEGGGAGTSGSRARAASSSTSGVRAAVSSTSGIRAAVSSTSGVRAAVSSTSGVRPAAVSSPRMRSPNRPPPPGGEGQPLAKEIRKRWDAEADPFELLGLDEDADLTSIITAAEELKSRLDASEEDEPPSWEDDEVLADGVEAIEEVVAAARAYRLKLCEKLGPAMLRERDWPKATALYEDLLTFKKGHVPTRVALAWIRFHTSTRTAREAQRAHDALDLLIGEDPEHADAHYYRGYMLVELDKSAQAAKAFVRAAELDPENVDASRQARAIKSGKAPDRARAKASKAAEREREREKVTGFKPKNVKGRSPYWTGAWPAIWILTGILFAALLAAQIVLRLDVEF